MVELSEPFKKDRRGLWYVDEKDVDVTPFTFPDIKPPYAPRAHFFKIEGNDDYIIKDTTLYPFFFNRIRTINNIKKLQDKQEALPNIDFPIGYYKDKKGVNGTIIKYYPDAISLRKFIALYKLNDLEDIYYRDPNQIDNLISLFLEVLELISSMYKEGIVYLDIHSGNFLIYKNSIKVIDFEPGYIYYDDNSRSKYDRLIRNYTMLVETVCRYLGYKGILLSPDYTFIGTEKRVKALRKELER